jgi:hypothetical protein
MFVSPYSFWIVATAAAAIGIGLEGFAWAPHKRLLRGIAWLWIAYAVWESAVQIFTPEANIRADLLLIYPTLLIGTLIGFLLKPASAAGR